MGVFTFRMVCVGAGSIEVIAVRFLTDKKTKQPRGVAFVEFKDSLSLRVCLAAALCCLPPLLSSISDLCVWLVVGFGCL